MVIFLQFFLKFITIYIIPKFFYIIICNKSCYPPFILFIHSLLLDSLFFIEDPIRSENHGSYRNLRRQVNLPIAAGEQWASKWDFREVIEEDLIDYARIDLCIVGGLTEALKITHWAETHYIDIVPHNPLGPVSAAACAALCMASTNVGVLEMPRRPSSYATGLFPQQIEWADGYSWCPDVPGLGVEFDIEAAENSTVEPHGWQPRLRRNDGALTNW